MASNNKDLTGERFGRLTCIGRCVFNAERWTAQWWCVCDCGNVALGRTWSLQYGDKQSCGCLMRENRAQVRHRSHRHGMSAGDQAPEYRAWRSMIQRCHNPNCISYRRYGAIGRTVCDEWRGRGGFQRFYDHIGPQTSPEHSLDRIDNSLGYFPGNVRWATNETQQNNRGGTSPIEFRGETLTITQWAERTGIPYSALLSRLRGRKWSVERALTTPLKVPMGKDQLTPEKRCWNSMKNRCLNTRSNTYADYGGRGISVCDEWRRSFDAFLSHVGPRPSAEYTLDRIDNDRGYEPGNVRWATKKQQNNNRRSTHMVTHNGETHSIAEWAEIVGISYWTLNARLRKCGWSVSDALTVPSVRGGHRPRGSGYGRRAA